MIYRIDPECVPHVVGLSRWLVPMVGGKQALKALALRLPDPTASEAETTEKMRQQLSEEHPLVIGSLVMLGAIMVLALDEVPAPAPSANPPVVDPMGPTQCPYCKGIGRHAEHCQVGALIAELRAGRRPTPQG